MKHLNNIILLLTIIVLSLFTSNCTTNDGDIGPLFGKWKLVEIIDNNKVVGQYTGNIYWSFQNSTLGFTRVNNHNAYDESYCNWTTNDNTLIINFVDSIYRPFSEMGLTEPVCELNINKLDGSEMILSLISSPTTGNPRIYKFKKW